MRWADVRLYGSGHREERDSYAYVERLFKQSCSPKPRAIPELKCELTQGVFAAQHPLYLRSPGHLDAHERYHYFADSMHSSWLLPSDLDLDQLLEHYRSSLNASNTLRAGCITYSGKDEVTVLPDIIRTPKPSDLKVAEGLFYKHFTREQWFGAYPLPEFYSDKIAPHFKSTPAETPIEWATKRMSLVISYAAHWIGRDYPFFSAEVPYQEMANLVCNSTPKALLKPRQYQLNEKTRALLEQAECQLPQEFIAEIAILILENESCFENSALEKGAIKDQLGLLPKALANGLVIDRVTELTKQAIQHGLAPRDALEHSLKIALAIYSGDQKPWWFKEDFDLRSKVKDDAAWTNDQLQLREQLASTAGFSFQYSEEIYQRTGYALAAREGITQKQAIDFCCEVSVKFGIGNVARAGNVIEYALHLIDEAPIPERASTLGALAECLARHTPQSTIIGVLEGKEVNFEKPGIDSLLFSLLGEDRVARQKLDALTLEAPHLRALTEQFSRPLLERAATHPALRPGFSTAHLITAPSRPGRLLLPVRAELEAVAEVNRPLHSWLEFDQQLARESRLFTNKVAKLYFTFYAPKFPDPFKPPDGFIAFIEKLENIPDPNYQYSILFDPREHKAIEHANNQRLVDRHLLIASMIDAWVMGLVDWSKLEATFKWLTEEITAEERDAVEARLTWEEAENKRDQKIYRAEHLEREDSKLKHEIQRLERSIWIAEASGDESLHYLKRSLAAAQEKKRRLANDYDERHRDLDELPKAKRKEREEQYFMERARDEAARYQSAKQSARLSSLAGAFSGLAFLNELACDKSVKGALLASSFERVLDACRSRPAQVIDSDSASAPLESSDIRDALRFNLVNIKQLTDRISRCSNVDDFAQLFSDLEGILQSLSHARQIANGQVKATHSKDPEARRKQLDSARQDFVGRLANLAGSSAMLDLGNIQALLTDLFWVDRYEIAFEEVARFRKEQLEPRYKIAPGVRLNGAEASVSEANLTVFALGYILRTLNTFDRATSASLQALLNSSARLQAPEIAAGSPIETQAPNQASLVSVEQAELANNFEQARAAVSNFREESFGLLPVGGKIHVMHQIDSTRLSYFREQFGFKSTAFHLIHADSSLILPAMPSAEELKLIIGLLDKEQVVDWDHPELQISISGRLPNVDCAFLGAAILLSTEEGVEYRRDAFDTNQDQATGFRIMIYDAGGPRSEYPFCPSLAGRTDIQGRRHLNDISRYQLLGSVLVNGITDGPFSHLAAPFKQRFEEILLSYQLDSVLRQSWVMGQSEMAQRRAGLEHYLKAVKPCTEAWRACNRNYRKTGQIQGVVADVQKLFDWLQKEVRLVQGELLSGSTFEKERKLLLEL